MSLIKRVDISTGRSLKAHVVVFDVFLVISNLIYPCAIHAVPCNTRIAARWENVTSNKPLRARFCLSLVKLTCKGLFSRLIPLDFKIKGESVWIYPSRDAHTAHGAKQVTQHTIHLLFVYLNLSGNRIERLLTTFWYINSYLCSYSVTWYAWYLVTKQDNWNNFGYFWAKLVSEAALSSKKFGKPCIKNLRMSFWLLHNNNNNKTSH